MERVTYQELPVDFFNHLRQIESYLSDSEIESCILDLIKIRASQINHCAYCLDIHYKESRANGESELRLSVLSAWNETELFSEKEKAVLAYTEALTNLKTNFLEDAFNTLSNFYSNEQIAIISLAITQINTWNRLMKAFQFKAGYYKVSS